MRHPPELKRKLLHGGVLVALMLAMFVASMTGRASFAAPVLQVTDTHTPTTTPTESPSATASPTGSLTPTASGSPSASVSPSATVTVTGTPPTPTPTTATAAAASPTLAPTPTPFPTLPAFTPPPEPTATPLLLPSPGPLDALPSATPGPPTATLKPFPQITYQYPDRTPTYTLLARQGDSPGGDPPKNDGFSIRRTWNALARAAPWLLIGALWLGLGIWFVVSQIWLHRSK